MEPHILLLYKLKIGIDARPLSRTMAGIGRIVFSQLKHMAGLCPDWEFLLYSNTPFSLPDSLREKTKIRSGKTLGKYCPGTFWLGTTGRKLIKKDNPDVFWGTQQYLPAGLPYNVIKILTVLDLAWMRYPQSLAFYNLLVQKRNFKRSILYADVIMAISEFTRDELVKEFPQVGDKVKVVSLGVDKYFFDLNPDAAARIAQTFGLNQPYIFCAATLEPRKNMELALSAYSLSREKLPNPPQFVIAGAKGWKSNKLRKILADIPGVHYLGYVSWEELQFLYSASMLFVFPSLYEGFGLPVLEAMASGCAVIASDIPPLRALLDNAGVLIKPDNAETWASSMIKLINDSKERQRLGAMAKERAAEFTWTKSAERVMKVIESQVQTFRGTGFRLSPE